MISAHLPVLQVVLPLLSASLCLLFRRAYPSWLLALIMSWISFAIAANLLGQVITGEPISYLLGDWAAPWGIEYKVDVLAAFVLLLVSGIGAVIMLFAPSSIAAEIPEDRVYLFYSMYLLTFAGLLGMVITGDVFNLFVFLEISSLSTYVMISLGKSRRAMTAAFRYLVLGTVGATFYVIGVGMMYQMTGTLNMADLADKLPAVAESRTILVAIGFLTVGIGLKLGLFPVHLWLPNAYAYAPSVVTAFLAATATKVAVYALLRIYFTVFGVEIIDAYPLNEALLILGLAAILSMSTVAIFQNDVKRLLAYSSVAQLGYMIIGISFLTVTGVAAGILHLFNHGLMKAALFLVLACVFLRIKSVKIDDMAGLGKAMPLTMAAFVLAGFSLIGIPLTVGFVSKWYLITASIEQDNWIVAAVILFSSLLAVIYFWKVVEIAYFRPRADGAAPIYEAPAAMLVPLWILVGANIFFGIYTDLTITSAMAAAQSLMGASP
ncbi:MAG: cation:proton antiporter [Rhodospirillaceae bacterium TMED167]|nr:cation:proton antiporter [Rhodospirillaceae bacterium]OUW30248.1 MAG: cation:proton antiporter [Rhodospirillaceae bacterium TMED167]